MGFSQRCCLAAPLVGRPAAHPPNMTRVVASSRSSIYARRVRLTQPARRSLLVEAKLGAGAGQQPPSTLLDALSTRAAQILDSGNTLQNIVLLLRAIEDVDNGERFMEEVTAWLDKATAPASGDVQALQREAGQLTSTRFTLLAAIQEATSDPAAKQEVLAELAERAHAFCSSAGALAAAVAGSSVAGSTALPSASGGGQHSVRDALLRANAASAEVLERIVQRAAAAEAKVQSLEAALSKSDRGGSDVSAEVWSRAVAGYVDTAHLRTALSEARSDAETCLAGLDAGSSVEVDELRTQLQLAQEAAQSCLVQMGSAAPNDEVWSRAVTTQVEISRLRAAAAACDPLAVAQSRAGAVREALTRANAASAEALERLLLRATAPEAKANESAGVSENARAAQQAALAKQADFARDTIARANAASAEVLEKLLLRAKTAEGEAGGLRAKLTAVDQATQETAVGVFGRSLSAYVDKARLTSALSDARTDAESCLASLDKGSSGEIDTLRAQLQEARDAANACLVQMGSAEPVDGVWDRAVQTQVEIARLRAAAAACDPAAMETAKATAVRDALSLANSTYADALERLMQRAKSAEEKVEALSTTLSAAETERKLADDAWDSTPAAAAAAAVPLPASSEGTFIPRSKAAELIALVNSRAAGLAETLFGRTQIAERAAAEVVAAEAARAGAATASVASAAGDVAQLVSTANESSAGVVERLYRQLQDRQDEVEALKKEAAAARAREAEAVASAAELVTRANASSAEVIEKLSDKIMDLRKLEQREAAAGEGGVSHDGVNSAAVSSAEAHSLLASGGGGDAAALSAAVASLQSALVVQATAANGASANLLEQLFSSLQAARTDTEAARAAVETTREEKHQAEAAAAALVARANETSSAVVEKLFSQLQEARSALASTAAAPHTRQAEEQPAPSPSSSGLGAAVEAAALLERSNSASAAVIDDLFAQMRSAQGEADAAKAAADAASAEAHAERGAAAEQLASALVRANDAAAVALEKLFERAVTAEEALRREQAATSEVLERTAQAVQSRQAEAKALADVMGMREARAEIEFARSEAAEGAASALRDQLAEATQRLAEARVTEVVCANERSALVLETAFVRLKENSEALQAEVVSLRSELNEKQGRLAQLEQDRESTSEQWQAMYQSEVSSVMGAGKVAVEIERERKLKAVEGLLAASDEAAVKHKEELQAMELAFSRQREEIEALRMMQSTEMQAAIEEKSRMAEDYGANIGRLEAVVAQYATRMAALERTLIAFREAAQGDE